MMSMMSTFNSKQQESTDSRDNIIMQYPEFNGKNVPVKEAARLMGKDQQFIRQGIIRGILPIGIAFKKRIVSQDTYKEKESSQYDFYISPKLLWEYTGILYKS